jgi:N-acetylglutamate synthase-like GNAT family acetyltransferase
MVNYKLTQTDDYEELKRFFIENELEFSEDDPEPADLVKCWRLTDEDSYPEKLIGGAVLAKRDGEFIIDGIAVDSDYRRKKLGEIMMDKAIEEIKAASGDSLYLVARTPDFYRALGFITVPKESAPNFIACLTCPQFEVSCHPEVMKLSLPSISL